MLAVKEELEGQAQLQLVSDEQGLPAEVSIALHAQEGAADELDLTPGDGESGRDAVATYLREMGRTPLLTREGEVRLAQRIERGQKAVRKAISRSPIIWRELIALGKALRCGERSVEEILELDDTQLNFRALQSATRKILRTIDQIAPLERLIYRDFLEARRAKRNSHRHYRRQCTNCERQLPRRGCCII